MVLNYTWSNLTHSRMPSAHIHMHLHSHLRFLAVHRNNNFKGSIYMVFDYAEYDLTGLMETVKYKFSEAQVRLEKDMH